jgi:hypothetical protein
MAGKFRPRNCSGTRVDRSGSGIMHNEALTEPGRSEARAIVPLESAAAPQRPAPRPLASFVTQLIACDRRLPAYRERRRGSPDEARSRYDAVGRPPAARGRFERVT